MQYDDDILEGLVQAFVDAKEKPYGNILAAKLLYALPELPFPSNMDTCKRFLEHPDDKAEAYSEFYSGRVNFLLDVSFEHLENPGRVSETAQHVLFAHMRIPPNVSTSDGNIILNDEVRDRMFKFLSHGWPDIHSPLHKPLTSPPVPYFRFVASWVDHCYGMCAARARVSKDGSQLPDDLVKAMLKWSLGHRIDLKESPEAIRLYQEFLTGWDKNWHEKIRLPDIRNFGSRSHLQADEFGARATLPEEVASRAGMVLAFHLFGSSEGAKELLKHILTPKK